MTVSSHRWWRCKRIQEQLTAWFGPSRSPENSSTAFFLRAAAHQSKPPHHLPSRHRPSLFPLATHCFCSPLYPSQSSVEAGLPSSYTAASNPATDCGIYHGNFTSQLAKNTRTRYDRCSMDYQFLSSNAVCAEAYVLQCIPPPPEVRMLCWLIPDFYTLREAALPALFAF